MSFCSQLLIITVDVYTNVWKSTQLEAHTKKPHTHWRTGKCKRRMENDRRKKNKPPTTAYRLTHNYMANEENLKIRSTENYCEEQKKSQPQQYK